MTCNRCDVGEYYMILVIGIKAAGCLEAKYPYV